MPEEIMPQPRPSIDVSLQRVTTDQVRVQELSTIDDHREVLRDLVKLDLGSPSAKVSILGTLEEILDVLAFAIKECARVNNERTAAGR